MWQTKLVVTLVITGVLAALVAWGAYERDRANRLQEKLAVAEARVKAHRASTAAQARASADLKLKLRRAEASRKAAEETMERVLQGPAKAWADTPVPESVREAL